MQEVIIEGQCWCTYKKTMALSDIEAEEFMKECKENMDSAYCQIVEEDITGIDCVDEGTVSCSPSRRGRVVYVSALGKGDKIETDVKGG